MPVPWVLVEKYGLNRLFRTSGGMPTPVSATSTVKWLFSRNARSVSFPPVGMASSALISRFSTACWNFWESSDTNGSISSGLRQDDLHVLVGRLRPDQPDGLVQHLQASRRLQVEPLQAGKVAEPFQDAVQPADLRLHDAQQIVERLGGGQTAQTFVEQLDVQAQGGQRVLEFVVQSGGQRSEADEPLHPRHAFLEQHAFGDVAKQEHAAQRLTGHVVQKVRVGAITPGSAVRTHRKVEVTNRLLLLGKLLRQSPNGRREL